MGLFKRRKKRTEDPFLEEVISPQSRLNPRQQAEHAALGYCEQLMEQSRELEEGKKEYRLITSYLEDIQKLEDMPRKEFAPILEYAKNILELNQKQEELGKRKRTISDVQYAQMEQMADEIPRAIRRLKNNENYQSMVKRDMTYMEGEKSEWDYYLESVRREQKLLKGALFAILGLLVAAVCVLGYLKYGLRMNTTVWMLASILLAVLTGGGCLLRLQGDREELRRARASVNRAITVSNQLKAKYVNATNAVDFACEKFHVTNSMELNYLWEQYQEAARERAEFEKANEELGFYCKKLVQALEGYQFYDAQIWSSQVTALVDKKEMVEMKHSLIVQRQKLRARIEQQVKGIQESKRQILLLLRDKREYHQEIMEVLRTVDKMCGE